MHRNHTYDSTLNSSAMAAGLVFKTGEISGLPLEYRKDDYIYNSYP